MSPYPTLIPQLAKPAADRFRSAVFNSRGISLIEMIIALAMFSSAGTAVLLGVSAAHNSSTVVEGSAIAENLARNQMEYVFTQPYEGVGTPYPSVTDDSSLNITLPSGFGVGAVPQIYVTKVPGSPGSIQKGVVTVTRDGQSILILESLRSGP